MEEKLEEISSKIRDIIGKDKAPILGTNSPHLYEEKYHLANQIVFYSFFFSDLRLCLLDA